MKRRLFDPTSIAFLREAREQKHAICQRDAKVLSPDGKHVIIIGGPDFKDTDAICATLDKARDRLGDIVLLHGGLTFGTDRRLRSQRQSALSVMV